MPDESMSQDGASALIHPVVLCGGSGTRLWPLSRPSRPKQFLALADARSMLEATVARAAGPGFAPPLLVAGEALGALARDQLAAAGVEPAAILLEPAARNTAAAIALTASFLTRGGGDAVMLVMPSDHLIRDEDAFRRAVEIALPAARQGALATFGISPTAPETGYGYIRPGSPWPDAPGVSAVDSFFEKPDPARAAEFVAKGYLWNGGIFLFRASAFLEELGRHAPEIASGCAEAMASSTADGPFVRPSPAPFLQVPSVAVDVAVMERTSRACVVPVDLGWSDLGSWEAVWAAADKDERGNALQGDAVAIESFGSLVRNESGLTVVTVGVEDLVVVATQEAILIVPREQAQKAGLAAAAFEARGR